MKITERAAEARVRRAAERLELTVSKSRSRLGSIDNYGGYQIYDWRNSKLIGADRFKMSLAEVAGHLADYAKSKGLAELAASLKAVAAAKII